MSDQITGAADSGGLMHRLQTAEPGWRKQPQSLPVFAKEPATNIPSAEVRMAEGDEPSRRGADDGSAGAGEGEWRNITDCDGATFDVWVRNVVEAEG